MRISISGRSEMNSWSWCWFAFRNISQTLIVLKLPFMLTEHIFLKATISYLSTAKYILDAVLVSRSSLNMYKNRNTYWKWCRTWVETLFTWHRHIGWFCERETLGLEFELPHRRIFLRRREQFCILTLFSSKLVKLNIIWK